MLQIVTGMSRSELSLHVSSASTLSVSFTHYLRENTTNGSRPIREVAIPCAHALALDEMTDVSSV